MFESFFRRCFWIVVPLTFTAFCNGVRADLIVGESNAQVYLYAEPHYNEQTFFNSQASGIAPLNVSGAVANSGSHPSSTLGNVIGGGGTINTTASISSTWMSASQGNVDFSVEATAPGVFFESQPSFPWGGTAGLQDGLFRHTFTSSVPFQYVVNWQTDSFASGNGFNPGIGISVGNGLGSYAFVPLNGDGQFTINAVAGTHQFFYRLEGATANSNPSRSDYLNTNISVDANFSWQVVTAVPEPSSLILGLPCLAIGTWLRRRRKQPLLSLDQSLI